MTTHGPVVGGLAGQIAWRDPLVRLPQFLTGLCIARLYITGPGSWRWASPVSIGALLTLVIALAASAQVPDVVLHQGVVTPLVGLLIYALAMKAGPLAALLAHPRMLMLGEASYALYILHEPLWSWLVGSTTGLVADHGP